MPVFRTRRVWVREPHRGRLVKVKRLRRVWLLGPCASLPSIETLGTPVTVNLLDQSALTFDFSAFKRVSPLTGSLRGYVPGKLLSDADNQVILTSGSFQLGKTTMFSDKVCGGQPSDSIRTGDPSTLKLDPGKQSTLTLGKNGALTRRHLRRAEPPAGTAQRRRRLRQALHHDGVLDRDRDDAPDRHDRRSGSRPGAGEDARVGHRPARLPEPRGDDGACNGFQVPLPATISLSLQVAVVADGS